MKNMLVLFFVLFLSMPLFTTLTKSTSGSMKQMKVNDSFIYVKHTINNTVYVFVYLSDGVTLVNIYEEED